VSDETKISAMDSVGHDDEIVASQEQLGQALDKARAGDDRALAVAVREDGEQFVRVLFGLFRMIRLHDLENEAFAKPILECVEVLNRLVTLLGSVNVVSVEDQVYVNDVRIRFDERAEAGRGLGREVRRHRVGGITFHSECDDENIKCLVHAFARDPDEDMPRTVIQKYLADGGADHIEVFGVFRFRVTGEEAVMPMGRGEDRIDETQMSDVIDRGSDLVTDTMDNLASDRLPNPLPLRRIVTEIVDGGVGAEGLWDESGIDGPHAAHVMRVCRVALLIGGAVGLSAEALQDLGVAALFHDVGYAAREGSIKAGPDTEGELGYAPPFERHGAAGARLLLRQKGFHQAKILRILATLEHHMDYDPGDDNPSLFGRILRIAEDFDNLIRGRAGGFTPIEAIGRMIPWSGKRYDPELLQVFVNTMGRYPPGTMMLLGDGRIAVSVGTARDEKSFDKPVVRVVRDASGHQYEESEVLDLAKGGSVRLVLNSRPESLQRG
jgi:hypothetical protein